MQHNGGRSMSLAIRNFVETDDSYLAAFAHYLGYRIIKCTTPLAGAATFGLLVPQCDWQIVTEEFNNTETAIVNIKKYAESCKVCHSLIRKSKQNGGVFGEKLVGGL